MPLPSCLCVAGRPPFDRLGDIFCALSQIYAGCTTPELVSATIVDGMLTLVFSVEVTGHDGFVLEIDAGNTVLTYESGEETSTLIFSSVPAAGPGEEVILSYAPGDVANGDCILAEFSGFEVTNNTGLEFIYNRPGGADTYLRPGGVDTYIRP